MTGRILSHPLLEPAIGLGARRPESPLVTLGRWLGRRRQRLALAELSEQDGRLLDDVGLTRDEARREADKPFWKL